MKYIELPSQDTHIQIDSAGYHYFQYENSIYFLHKIELLAKDGDFRDEEKALCLTVTSACPKKDQLYVEFLPQQDKPGSWCEICNGLEKNELNNKRWQTSRPWTSTFQFYSLSKERKSKVLDARHEQKEDRYQKGPKSV